MGNTHVSVSIPEAASKFSPAELQELGRTYRRLVKHSTDGRLHYRALFRSLQKYYTHAFLFRLFRVAASWADGSSSGSGGSAGGPADGGSSPDEAPDLSVDYDGLLKLTCLLCRWETDGLVQLLLEGFAGAADGQRFTKLTLHCALLVISLSAAQSLGVDLLNEAGREEMTVEETNAEVSNLVGSAFALTAKPALVFKETVSLFARLPHFLAYLRYGVSHLFHVQPTDKHTPGSSSSSQLGEREASPSAMGVELPAELARRLIPVPPKLLGLKSEAGIVQNAKTAAVLVNWLPVKYRDTSMVQLYNTHEHGFSLSTLLFTFERKHKALVKEACLLLVQDHEDNVFGAFVPCPPLRHGSGKFYGDRSTFLFRLRPTPPQSFATSGRDQNYIFTTQDGGLGFGGSLGYHGFFVDAELKHGYFRRCETFLNAEASETSAFRFQVKAVECWGLMQNRRMEFYTDEKPDDDDGRDPDRTDVSKSSILNKASGADNFILQMIGGGGPTRDQHG